MAWTKLMNTGDPATDLTGTAYRTLLIDSAGDVVELAHGTSGYFLQSAGATADPVWADVGAVTLGDFMWKQPARLASTANIDLTTGTLLTIDGFATVAGDRVLVKDQTTGSQNGIYIAGTGTWARATDSDTSAEVKAGLRIAVEEGTVGADTQWMLTTDNPITLDTTALTFARALDKLSDTVPNTIQPDDAASAGTASEASRQDHEHAIVAAAPTGSVGTAFAEGTGTSFVREDHVHDIGVGAIDASNLFAASVVDNAAMADDAIKAAEIDSTVTDITFAQIVLTPAVSGTGTTEGTVFYDSDDNHLYVYIV